MSLHDRPHLNAARRRARKRTLARRDGAHCTYCRRPFEDLRSATLDHVAPIRLFRTWSADHLVLACRPCNTAKADRFPLLLALLLCQSTNPTAPTVWIDWPMLARVAHAWQTAAHADRSADSAPIESGCQSSVHQPVHDVHGLTRGVHARVHRVHRSTPTRLCSTTGRTAA
ncbi:HNH endonuclease [Streptomyces virginiae]|uniref:HNH endonuclease n=1 Tax=Streptomyces virginiae TaxID=1961 RepID=UPI0036E186F8